ncbi:hypothetical protein E9529_01495 [Blastococcus sp. KM273128]|uniref:hypothetical protein n=1 Tax=Blastococcus sp. KM273128 TaxID=2570314 RepID=UPI001F17C97C|nr:hypothetical protein [Blastococcus sp. KM273128]MCF6742964.1 hypothetical protein [Blastococcus sp. KM273128]
MTTTKVLLGTLAGLVVVGAVAAAGVAVAMPAGVDGPGAVLAELQGHTRTSDHSDADDAPRGDVPPWTRAVGHDVTVVRPGEASGDDSGSVRAEMALDEGAHPPADCTPLPQVGMPFDGGGNWPDLGDSARLCEGWVTVVLGDRLYTWTGDELQAAAG